MMPYAATWIELETLILTEVSQTEKDKYHMVSHVELKKKMQKNYKTEIDSQTSKTNSWLPRGKGGARNKLGV